mmetsp:Transcript_15654/g.40486  ORF Transcript_15654/g.40486 Transcript_15654/m.40486 type:complete len:204 (-) Transcript_15654:367-978(-)
MCVDARFHVGVVIEDIDVVDRKYPQRARVGVQRRHAAERVRHRPLLAVLAVRIKAQIRVVSLLQGVVDRAGKAKVLVGHARGVGRRLRRHRRQRPHRPPARRFPHRSSSIYKVAPRRVGARGAGGRGGGEPHPLPADPTVIVRRLARAGAAAAPQRVIQASNTGGAVPLFGGALRRELRQERRQRHATHGLASTSRAYGACTP